MIRYSTYSQDLFFTNQGKKATIRFHYMDYSWGGFFTSISYLNTGKEVSLPSSLPSTSALFTFTTYGLFFAMIVCIILAIQSFFTNSNYLGGIFYLVLSGLSIVLNKKIASYGEIQIVNTLKQKGWNLEKPEDLSFKEILKKEFGFDLPISGGFGSSIDDAIKIDKEYLDWSDVIYTCLRLNNRLLHRSWELVKNTNIEKNGRIFDQMKIKVEGDDNNYYNYYFDVTDHMNAPLYGGGTAWPDEDSTRKRFQI